MPYQNYAAEQVFGTLGTICWTAQMIPQVWKSWREKSTDGLSYWLVFLWGIASVFQGVYSIVQKINIPLMIQPQIFGFLSLLSWGQCLYYGMKRSRTVTIIITASVVAVCGGFEAGLVFALRPSHDQGKHAATDAFGIIASALISLALFPQYWEIYKHKEVVGISIMFISIDLLGGVFNDLSLAFKEEFDIIAAVCYSLVVVLDGVVLIAALILNPRARRRREREAAEKAIDESTRELNIGTVTPLTDTCDPPPSSSMHLAPSFIRPPSVSSTVVANSQYTRVISDEEKIEESWRDDSSNVLQGGPGVLQEKK